MRGCVAILVAQALPAPMIRGAPQRWMAPTNRWLSVAPRVTGGPGWMLLTRGGPPHTRARGAAAVCACGASFVTTVVDRGARRQRTGASALAPA